ncbi:MAG: hypothetical protein H7Y20_01785 [Bryobacteraceae bacterium]|nr:hypothetical protein [Bryobacteraceae bacterium]
MEQKRNPEDDEVVLIEGVRVPKWVAERLPKLAPGRRSFVLGTLRRRQEQPEPLLSREEVNALIGG